MPTTFQREPTGVWTQMLRGRCWRRSSYRARQPPEGSVRKTLRSPFPGLWNLGAMCGPRQRYALSNTCP
ncbi:hypothetical protein Pmani_023709 [Petrolisthes manimaculis]|uniref:Uncharacterized protein n=1 Tax=Petrolisthes manimaculis TaxID=1843537 RepID=A0AAE1PBG7_9EUCA|nr:hypothetical protein Pmani_023709 [Petrolisthes manimaculis]